MKYRLKEILPSIDYYELLKLKKDLNNGGIHFKKLIDTEIKKQENTKEQYCAVCMKTLESKDKSFTLTFGPEDFKKKASFCEVDCLTYFTNKIKKQPIQIEKPIEN